MSLSANMKSVFFQKYSTHIHIIWNFQHFLTCVKNSPVPLRLKYYIDLCKVDIHSVYRAMIKPGNFYVHMMQINLIAKHVFVLAGL